MVQDAALDNLVAPPGYKAGGLGSLGAVLRAGTGEQAMILIPGLGFGGRVFGEFMDELAEHYRVYAVTLAGFGGTAAPPCPAEGTSFGEQTWTRGALDGIEKLIKDEGIRDPIVVGHWLTGTQLALRLALRQPETVKAVILLSGSARMVVTDPRYEEYYGTLARRVASIDTYLAPQWFKTVTRETWDDNNFLPGDYAVDPVRGLRLWREAARPPLHVWVRYLCEFNAQDISTQLHELTVPTLILKPGLEGLWHVRDQNYLEAFCHKSWEGRVEGHPRIEVRTIPHSRVCLWFDQPRAVLEALSSFVKAASARVSPDGLRVVGPPSTGDAW
jgi:pimeloyl-ACP methyl ester carboxylesterase